MYSKIGRALLWLAVFLFSLALPFQLGKHFFFSFSYLSGIRIDYLAPTIYLTDLLSLPFVFASLFILYRKRKVIKDLLQKNILIGIGFFILVDINYVFALSKELWFYSLVRMIQWALVFYFFWSQKHKKTVYSAVIYGLLLGSLLEVWLSLQQLMMRHSMQGLWWYLGERRFYISTPGIAKAYLFGKEFLRPYGTFSHPNSLAGFYLLLYAFTITQKRITNVIIKSLLLILPSFLILLSFSRSVIIIYAGLNLLYFSRQFMSCKLCMMAKIVVALFLIFLAISISGDRDSMNKRTDFIQKSISIIKQKPLGGSGLGGYLLAQHAYPQKFSTFFEQPVHNIFLLAVAQLGIPFSLFLLVLIIQVVSVEMSSTSSLFPLLAVLGTGMIDHYWLTLQQNVLVTAVIFGILFVYAKKTSGT